MFGNTFKQQPPSKRKKEQRINECMSSLIKRKEKKNRIEWSSDDSKVENLNEYRQ